MTFPKLAARVRIHNDASGRRTALLAFADLVVGEAFVIKGLRVLRSGDAAPFVVWPAEWKGERWHALAHPASKEGRSVASSVVLAEYARVMEKTNGKN